MQDPATAPPSRPLLLLVLLAFVAGLVDVTGWLTFDGLFTAQVTGNLVLLAAGLKGGDPPAVARILAVPVFMASLALGCLAAGLWPDRRGRTLLLSGQTLLLLLVWLSMLLSSVACRAPKLPLAAAMLAVATIGLQCALVRGVLHDGQATSVMTSNLVTVVVSAITLLQPGTGNPRDAKEKLHRTLPVVLAFVAGCPVGALSVARLGPAWCWAIPVLASLVALAAGRVAPHDRRLQSLEARPVP